MRTIEIEKESSKPISAYAKDLGEDLLVFTSNKQPVAAIVPLKNVDMESLALSYHPDFMEIIEKAREEVKACKTLSLEEMKDKVMRMEEK